MAKAEKCLKLNTGEMLLIEAGKFKQGNSIGGIQPEASPAHKTFVDSFYIDRTQVTNEQFSKFCNETGYKSTAESIGYGDIFQNGQWAWVKGACWHKPLGPGSNIQDKLKHPVILVTQGDALAYCKYRSQMEDKFFRLPTEAEWEKAARGDTGKLYPWGDCDINANGIIRACYNTGKPKSTQPAGSFPEGASPYGVLDMAGNAWDWCLDAFDAHYYYNAPLMDKGGPISISSRSIFRGGSWIYPPDRLISTYRHKNRIARSSAGIGFRCVSPVKQSFDIKIRIFIRQVVHSTDKLSWHLQLNYPNLYKIINSIFSKFRF